MGRVFQAEGRAKERALRQTGTCLLEDATEAQVVEAPWVNCGRGQRKGSGAPAGRSPMVEQVGCGFGNAFPNIRPSHPGAAGYASGVQMRGPDGHQV